MNTHSNHADEPAAEHQALCALEDIPEDNGREHHLSTPEGDAWLVLLRRGQAVYCYHNVCPHQGRGLNWAPDQFLFDQGHLVCAHHGASFVVESGECVAGPCQGASLRPLPVEVRDGQVWLVRAEPGAGG